MMSVLSYFSAIQSGCRHQKDKLFGLGAPNYRFQKTYGGPPPQMMMEISSLSQRTCCKYTVLYFSLAKVSCGTIYCENFKTNQKCRNCDVMFGHD